MNKKIGILQPVYMPWLGFFEQMAYVDEFVLLDDVQYTKQDWRNRNRIKTANGPIWLTVPVKHQKLSTELRNIEICYETNWIKKHVEAIKQSYSKRPYFQPLFDEYVQVLSSRYERLTELDEQIILLFCKYLKIETPVIYSSSFSNETEQYANAIAQKSGNIISRKNIKIISICKSRSADIFYEGKSGKDYIDIVEFKKHGTDVIFQDYKHPVYKQAFGDFIPFMSAIDLIMNEGPSSKSILSSSRIPAGLSA